ncbi:MAG: HlyD family efflux transporter periplasmic adaptor subunit [Betaproteobacteria bacterium]
MRRTAWGARAWWQWPVGPAVASALVAALVAACTPPAERPLQGYVEGEFVRIAAPFAGAMQQLSVKRGDPVSAGAPVFALERENEVAARRQAEQQLQAAEARLANLRTGKRPPEVETVSEQMRQAMAARDLAVANLKRQEKLHAEGFVSSAALDDARTQVKRDEAQVAQFAASVATAKLPARSDEIRAAEADARAARDVLAQADWRVAQRAVASPVAGLVNETYYVVGDWVPAGGPVASVLPPGNVKIRFYVAEAVLGRLKRGQAVSVACDGCAASIVATIVFIADRAEFTPPVLYSKDNRTKLVYLVEAKPSPQDAPKLHPGQPVDVTLPAS